MTCGVACSAEPSRSRIVHPGGDAVARPSLVTVLAAALLGANASACRLAWSAGVTTGLLAANDLERWESTETPLGRDDHGAEREAPIASDAHEHQAGTTDRPPAGARPSPLGCPRRGGRLAAAGPRHRARRQRGPSGDSRAATGRHAGAGGSPCRAARACTAAASHDLAVASPIAITSPIAVASPIADPEPRAQRGGPQPRARPRSIAPSTQ